MEQFLVLVVDGIKTSEAVLKPTGTVAREPEFTLLGQ